MRAYELSADFVLCKMLGGNQEYESSLSVAFEVRVNVVNKVKQPSFAQKMPYGIRAR